MALTPAPQWTLPVSPGIEILPMAGSGCLLPAQISPSACHLPPHASKSWPTGLKRALQRGQGPFIPILRTWPCPRRCHCWFPRAQVTGLKAPPMGLPSHLSRIGPAGAPAPPVTLEAWSPAEATTAAPGVGDRQRWEQRRGVSLDSKLSSPWCWLLCCG